MHHKMEKLVEECLNRFSGGKEFFEAVDSAIRQDDELLTDMLECILKNDNFDYLIVSGHFGQALYSFCEKNYFDIVKKVIVVNGDLRHEAEVEPFWFQYQVQNKNFVFLDDSYYLGRTRRKIEESIISHGGKLISIYVFYDGSKEKDSNVHSFYRYFDHYQN